VRARPRERNARACRAHKRAASAARIDGKFKCGRGRGRREVRGDEIGSCESTHTRVGYLSRPTNTFKYRIWSTLCAPRRLIMSGLCKRDFLCSLSLHSARAVFLPFPARTLPPLCVFFAAPPFHLYSSGLFPAAERPFASTRVRISKQREHFRGSNRTCVPLLAPLGSRSNLIRILISFALRHFHNFRSQIVRITRRGKDEDRYLLRRRATLTPVLSLITAGGGKRTREREKKASRDSDNGLLSALLSPASPALLLFSRARVAWDVVGDDARTHARTHARTRRATRLI